MLARRHERAALRENLRAETVIHHLANDQRACPHCGGVAAKPLGAGKETFLIEYVPGYFIRQRHVQEKAACTWGQFIATADPLSTERFVRVLSDATVGFRLAGDEELVYGLWFSLAQTDAWLPIARGFRDLPLT